MAAVKKTARPRALSSSSAPGQTKRRPALKFSAYVRAFSFPTGPHRRSERKDDEQRT